MRLDSLYPVRYTSSMKRLATALAALFVLGLSITGSVLLVRHQREVAAERQFAAAGPANLAREEAAARQEGIPLTAQQLQQPLPPTSQNAAPLYTKLTKLLHDKPLGLPKYAEGMDAFHSYTPAQIAAVRHTLAARQDVMALVHEAADKPRCVFVRDWSKRRDMAWPEYRAFFASSWLLKTESYLLARDGNYHEAITNQSRGLRVGLHAASAAPVLIEYLIGVACDSRALSGMQSILSLAGPSVAVDNDVQQELARTPALPSLRFAMAGETGFDCLAYEQMHQSEQYGAQEVMRIGGLYNSKVASRLFMSPAEQRRLHNLIDAWEADFLGHMRQVVSACDAPVAQRRAVFAALGEQPELSDPANSPHLASYVFLPVFSKIDQNDTRTRARVAVTLAAAAILGENAKTGALLNTLSPQFRDPFTDKPLLYRREGASGFVVYSAGPTGAFDGGRPGEKVPGQESVFRYPLVPVPVPPGAMK